MRQRHVLRHQPGGMDEDALLARSRPCLRAGDHLLYLGMQLLARELPAVRPSPKSASSMLNSQLSITTLSIFDPAGGIELAPRQRDEEAAGLEPGFARHDFARGGAADRDVGAAHHLLDTSLARTAMPSSATTRGEGRAGFRPPRRAADLLEPYSSADSAARWAHRPMPTRPSTFGARGPTHLQAIAAAAALRMA